MSSTVCDEGGGGGDDEEDPCPAEGEACFADDTCISVLPEQESDFDACFANELCGALLQCHMDANPGSGNAWVTEHCFTIYNLGQVDEKYLRYIIASGFGWEDQQHHGMKTGDVGLISPCDSAVASLSISASWDGMSCRQSLLPDRDIPSGSCFQCLGEELSCSDGSRGTLSGRTVRAASACPSEGYAVEYVCTGFDYFRLDTARDDRVTAADCRTGEGGRHTLACQLGFDQFKSLCPVNHDRFVLLRMRPPPLSSCCCNTSWRRRSNESVFIQEGFECVGDRSDTVGNAADSGVI